MKNFSFDDPFSKSDEISFSFFPLCEPEWFFFSSFFICVMCNLIEKKNTNREKKKKLLGFTHEL